MKRRTVLVAVLAVLVVAAGGIAVVQFVLGGSPQAPAFGVEDMGDWGEVTDERTEVVHTLWVENPNDAGVAVGNDTRLDYRVRLNGVRLANGTKRGLDLDPGNNTVRVSSFVRNDALPRFWVAYVRANETIRYRFDATATVGSVGVTRELPTRRGVALRNATPVVDAADEAANSTEGNYTRTVEAGDLPGELVSGVLGGESVTVGYRVEEAGAEWGTVTRETTTLLLRFTITNPSETVAEPGVPDGLAFAIDVNGRRVFEADGDALTPRNVGAEDVLEPGETETYTYEVRMDNSAVDEWFTSHVRNGERSTVAATLQLEFGIGDRTITVPEDGPVTYDCTVRTGILVDDQSSGTTCGEVPATGSRVRPRLAAGGR